MKKSFTAIMAGILTCCMLGVGCNFSSIVPEEFGEWESNYIYRGNVRSKTTGENGETLVTQVTKGDKTYAVLSCADYAFVGDDIYMCLNLNTPDFNMTQAIVKYNVKDKTQENIVLENTYTPEEGLTWVYQAYSIEQTFDDYMLVYGHRAGTQEKENGEIENTSVSLYYKIGYDGSLVEAESFDFAGYTRASDNYFTKTDYQNDVTSLYCITWDMEEPTYVCDLANGMTYQFIEKNGAAGVLLMQWGEETENTYYGKKLQKIQFFNVKNGEMKTLFEGDTLMQWVEIPTDEYFYTFTYETVTYQTRDHFFDEPTEGTTQMAKNCVLYQIEYSENGATLKIAQTFDKDRNFTRIKGVEVANGKRTAYVLANWYESPVGCSNGGYKEQAYKVDLNSGELTKIKTDVYNTSEDICYGAYALTDGVACGTYSYYLQRKVYSKIGKLEQAGYLLKRYNAQNGKTDAMQVWKDSSTSDAEEKYCHQMWKAMGGDIYSFIVRNY